MVEIVGHLHRRQHRIEVCAAVPGRIAVDVSAARDADRSDAILE
jgi:hypothetical protein